MDIEKQKRKYNLERKKELTPQEEIELKNLENEAKGNSEEGIKVAKQNSKKESTEMKILKLLLSKSKIDTSNLSDEEKKLVSDIVPEKEEKLLNISIRSFQGKLIKEWRLIKDEVYQNDLTRQVVEDQRYEITFFDGKKKEISMQSFNRDIKFVKFDIIEYPKRLEDGRYKYSFEYEGKKLKILDTFIN